MKFVIPMPLESPNRVAKIITSFHNHRSISHWLDRQIPTSHQTCVID